MRGRGDRLEAKRGYITRLRTQYGFTIEAIAVRLMCSYTLVQKKLKEWNVAPPIEGEIDEPEPDPMPEPEPEPIIEPEPAPKPEAGILPKTARQLLDERNAAILELVDAGMKDDDIARKLGLATRGVVIGVRHRNGRIKTDDEVRHASRQNAKRVGTMTSARRAHLKTPIAPPEDILKQIGATPLEGLAELEALAACRPERVVIPFEKVTGCHWPFGDIRDNPPLTYCNAPCCSVMVRGGDGKLIRTRYCAEHWNRRRSSNHTKIVA
jgi:hypothetical protein